MGADHTAVLDRFVEAVNTAVIPDDLLTADFEMVNAATAVTDNVYYAREGALRWRKDIFEAFKEGALFEIRVEGTTPEAGFPLDGDPLGPRRTDRARGEFQQPRGGVPRGWRGSGREAALAAAPCAPAYNPGADAATLSGRSIRRKRGSAT